MTKRSSLILMIALIATARPGLAQGPVSELYLTTGNEVYVVQGDRIVRSWRAAGQGMEYALAVGDDVRTVGHRRTLGGRYSLEGEDLVDRYQVPEGGPHWVFDGTTDGSFHYIFSDDGVWRFDQEWGSGVLLFAIANSRGNIAYDTQNDTLWVVHGSPEAIEERTMEGEFLRSFDPGFQNARALALDPADGTLWVGRQGMPGTLYQFTRDGEPLQTVLIPRLPEVLGGEFRITSGGGCVRDPGWVCDGDVDGDGQVNPVDVGLIQAAFGSVDEQQLCNYDMDCDGQVNPVDSGIVQSLFGTCDPPRDSCP